MQSTGQASTQAVSLVPMQGSAITYAINVSEIKSMAYPRGGTQLSVREPRQARPERRIFRHRRQPSLLGHYSDATRFNRRPDCLRIQRIAAGGSNFSSPTKALY